MTPIRVWIWLALLLSVALAGIAAGHHWAQPQVMAAQTATKAAQADARGWQIKYELCSANVAQLGAEASDARAKLAGAQSLLAASEAARAARTVTVVRRIQEAPTCNAALRSAWQSAPQ